MFREFNVKFEDVEMIGGTDNLLENTEITKVIVRGDSKMSSLDSTFKNCKELDTIDGELDLNGVSDIDNILQGTELVKSINLKNVNNENISANNSFPHIEEINIGGELYNKKAIQNVIASKDWTFDNINYQGTVRDNIVEKEVNVIDDNKATIKDTLEQKVREIEITGQTYNNLVVGSGEANLIDELSMESIEGKPNEFDPHLEQEICVEVIEGQTYQNLVSGKEEKVLIDEFTHTVNDFANTELNPTNDQSVCVEEISGETYQNLVNGKGEYKLTDTFSSTWTESNNSIENAPSMIEIPEIWGNTVQGLANSVSTDQIVTSLVNTINTGATSYSERYMPYNNGGYLTVSDAGMDINDYSLLTDECFIQLKPNTVYSYDVLRVGTTAKPNIDIYCPSKKIGWAVAGGSFTTDNTGKIIIYPITAQDGKISIKLVEGNYNLVNLGWDYDLSYIQSVGDLYVDESGEPILDEEGNEQYKLELNTTGKHNIIPYNVTYARGNMSIANGIPAQDENNTRYFTNELISIKPNTLYSTDLWIKTDGGHNLNGVFYYDRKGDFIGCYENVHYNTNITFTTPSRCRYIRLRGSQSTETKELRRFSVIEGEYNFDGSYIEYVEPNKTTILMPQPLRKVGNYRDRLYWDNDKSKFLIKGYTWEVKKFIPKSKFTLSDGYMKTNSWNGYDGKGDNLYPERQGTLITNFGVGSSSYTKEGVWISNKHTYITLSIDRFNSIESDSIYLHYIYGIYTGAEYLIETKILEKPTLETYSPKTYISTNSEVQPSQMAIVNKQTILSPLSLQANTDYTLQLDSTGKNDKSITVNLGGTETTIQPVNDTNKHHKFTVRTPATLTNETLELSGEGVVVNDVMLFEGGEDIIKQNVGYVDGIESIGIPITTKNILKPIFTLQNIHINDGSVWNDTNFFLSDYIEVEENTNYIFNRGKDSKFSASYVAFDENKSWLGNMQNNSWQTPSKTKYIRVRIGSGDKTNYPIDLDRVSEYKMQVEKGGSVTEYQEYYEGEKYKIDILTNDGVTSIYNNGEKDCDFIIEGSAKEEDNRLVLKHGYDGVIKTSKKYTIPIGGKVLAKIDRVDYGTEGSYVIRLEVNGKRLKTASMSEINSAITSNGYYMFEYQNTTNEIIESELIFSNYFGGYYISEISICSPNSNNKKSTQSILLPQPLNKIGEIKDKFYWDEDKGHYCIEQNIFPMVLDGSQSYGKQWGNKGYNCYAVNTSNPKKQYGYTVISDKLSVGGDCYSSPRRMLYVAWNTIIYIVLEEEYNIKSWLSDNPVTIYYLGDTPTIIDLPHLNKKLALDMYADVTHIDCPNLNLKPSTLELESPIAKYRYKGLTPNKTYNIQLDTKGTGDIKVNLGGSSKVVSVSEEYSRKNITITTPSTLANDKLAISNSGNSVKNVMLFDEVIKQEPEYIEGIQNIGEPTGDSYSLNILTTNGETLIEKEFSGENIELSDTQNNLNMYVNEIWGNTVQDETDLSIIQSVGELYVDENGDAILDEEGNEQYKLEIESKNLNNLIKYDEFLKMECVNTYCNPSRLFKLNNDGKLVRVIDYNDYTHKNIKFKLEPNEVYTLTMSVNGTTEVDGGLSVANAETISSTLRQLIFRTNSTGDCIIKIYPAEKNIPFDVKLEKSNGSLTGLEDFKGELYKTTILMPQPLRKINDDLYDKLYWDYEKNKYLIQRKIGKYFIDSNTNIRNYTVEQMSVYNINNCLPNAETIGEGRIYKAISPNFKKNHKVGGDWRDVPSIFGDAYNGGKDVSYSTPNMNLNSVSEFRNYCIENNIYVLYPIQTEIIETKILEKVTLETYSPKTYVSINTEIQPSNIAGVYERGESDEVPYLSSKQVIQIPQPLNKIGDVKDKFYWDDNKGHYCIEQNLISYQFNGLEEFGSIPISQIRQSDYYRLLFIPDDIELWKNNSTVFSSYSSSKIDWNLEAKNTYSAPIVEGGRYGVLFAVHKNDLLGVESANAREWIRKEKPYIIRQLSNPKIIDLPHLNKKHSLDTYMPTTYVECTNSPMQPSRLLLESDTVRYKPSTLETDTDYTVQFECLEKSDKKLKLNLGGAEKEVDAIVGLNHVSITTPSEIDVDTYKDRLFLSGVGNKVDNVMVVEGEMNQYPEYFDGIQSVGVLQDSKYKINVISSNEPTNVGNDVFAGYDISPFDTGIAVNMNLTMQFSLKHISDGAVIKNPNTGFDLSVEGGMLKINNFNFDEGFVTKTIGEASTQDMIAICFNATSEIMNIYKNSSFLFSLKYNLYGGEIKVLKDIAYLRITSELLNSSELLPCVPKRFMLIVNSKSPLAKRDRLYWNKSNNRYEIDRNGIVEVPVVEGDVVDLPRLYQREDTNLKIETGNIKPSEVKITYNDID